MQSRPLFSVIIPTHRRPHLLRRALESVKQQDSRIACEVIVISDQKDSDNDRVCDELLDGSDIYLRRNGRNGPAESRNIGLKLAQGQNILFLDDDDAWHPGLINYLGSVEALQNGTPTFCDCSVVMEVRSAAQTKTLSEVPLNYTKIEISQMYVKNNVHMSCFAFPRTVVEGLSFDSSLRAYEDWDFLLSVLDRIKPTYNGFLGTRVFEVAEGPTDRRGSSQQAKGYNAVLDYLYIYRRHPAPTELLKNERSSLFNQLGFSFPADMM